MPLVKRLLLSIFLPATPAFSHEAWVLSPREFDALAVAPIPPIFLSSTTLLAASVLALTLVAVALWYEEKWAVIEDDVTRYLPAIGLIFGGLILRIGLAIPLGLGALGGLPRHGTQQWMEPTLFVPDMQLTLVDGHASVAVLSVLVAALLFVGLWIRLAAVGVVVLALIGGQLFGSTFLYSYAAHFVGPAMLLFLIGAGPLSLTRLLGHECHPRWQQVTIVWPLVLLMTGATFIYLALALKLAHPTLLIAILDHAGFGRLGIPLSWIALVMMGVELIAGVLLMLGRLVRPIGLFLIFAFTFFSVILNETPLFHANLYALMGMLVLFGARPNADSLRSVSWPALTFWSRSRSSA